MNYVQFHVGDWDSSTRLLSPLEKGIYIDLLMLYYSVERPLMRSECERISRAYAPEEKAALEYVLDRFFHREGDVYAHHRCDEEIAKASEKSAKAAKSAQARWNKAAKGPASSVSDANGLQNGCTCNTDVDANGMRTHSERIADAMLTNNQEPITKEDISLVEKAPAELFPSEETTSDPLSICPAKEIVELFNSILGQQLGAVRKVTPARQQAMRARWHDMIKDSEAKTRADGLDWCRQYFEAVAKRPFLLGQKADSKWHADFDWLMQSRNYVKIFEGAYRG